MTLFWPHHSGPASEQTLLITNNPTAVGDTAWAQMWIPTSELTENVDGHMTYSQGALCGFWFRMQGACRGRGGNCGCGDLYGT